MVARLCILGLITGLLAQLPATAVSAPIEIVREGNLGFDDNGQLLGAPLSIDVDSVDGVLYIVCTRPPEVVAIDSAGRLVLRIGEDDSSFSPFGVWSRPDGTLVVSDSSTGRLLLFSSSGQVIGDIDLRATTGTETIPGRISGAEDGEMLVVDMGGDAVLRLGPDGELLSRIAGLDRPQKAVFFAGDILVACARGDALRRFDPEGRQLSSAGRSTDPEQQRVSYPGGLTVDARSRVWLADSFRHRVFVYDPQLNFVSNLGRMDDGRGKWGFLLPVDLAFGPHGKLHVIEKGADRVQVFQVLDPPEDRDE